MIISDDHGCWALGCAGNTEVKTSHLDRGEAVTGKGQVGLVGIGSQGKASFRDLNLNMRWGGQQGADISRKIEKAQYFINNK